MSVTTTTSLTAQLCSALEAIGQGFIACDDEGNVIFATPLAESLLGLKQSGQFFEPAGRLRQVSGEVVASFIEATAVGLPILLQAGERGEARMLKISGSSEQRAFLVQDVSNELGSGSKELETLDVLAHDLRAGLVPAKTYAQMMLGGMLGPVTEKQIEALKAVDICVAKQDARIGAVLDMVKAEEERLEPQIETLSLIDLVKPVIAQVERDSTRKGLKMVADLDPSTALVEADARRMQRILGALLSRGVKHTPAGGNVGLEMRYLADSRARIRIWDNGAGTPAEELNLMLLPARQQALERLRLKRPPDLEVVAIFDIVKAHQGSFSAQSSEGSGSTYTIYLPTQRRASAPPSPDGSSGALTALLAGPAEQMAPLRQLLEKQSVIVSYYENGKHALRDARQKHFPLVFVSENVIGISASELESAIALQRPEDVQSIGVIKPDSDPNQLIKESLSKVRPQ